MDVSGQVAGAALVTTQRAVSDRLNSGVSEAERDADQKARRADRYRMRREVGKLLGTDSNIQKCGMRGRPNGTGGRDSIGVRNVDGTAYFSGVLYCGSPWSCPVCSPKVLWRRGLEIDRILLAARARGGSVLFVTLTCRHFAWDDAKSTVKVMSQGVGKLLAGREWAGDTGKERDKKIAAGKPVSDGYKGELGYVGQVRVLELTHSSRNGFHPHVHAALFFDRLLDPTEIALFEIWLFRKWKKHLLKLTGREIQWGRGVDVVEWEGDEALGHYVTKIGQGWSLGSELTYGEGKAGKGMSRNPAQVARDYITGGSTEDGAILKEMWAATKGRNMVVFSQGLREWAGFDEDDAKSDEDLANEDVGGDEVAEIDLEVYGWIRRLTAFADVLVGAELAGVDGIVEALADLGLPVVVEIRPDSAPLVRMAFRPGER